MDILALFNVVFNRPGNSFLIFYYNSNLLTEAAQSISVYELKRNLSDSFTSQYRATSFCEGILKSIQSQAIEFQYKPNSQLFSSYRVFVYADLAHKLGCLFIYCLKPSFLSFQPITPNGLNAQMSVLAEYLPVKNLRFVPRNSVA